MEMCYDGALVMPSNYVMMDEEDMTYVEGGDLFDRAYIKFAISENLAKTVASAGVGIIVGQVCAALSLSGPAAIVLIPAATTAITAYFLDHTIKGDTWYKILIMKSKRLVPWHYEGTTTVINLGVIGW